MTRYQKHMQQVHNYATAQAIEMAVKKLIIDIREHLIKTGVKAGSPLLDKISMLQEYEYKPEIKK
jgi:hypothetical protein